MNIVCYQILFILIYFYFYYSIYFIYLFHYLLAFKNNLQSEDAYFEVLMEFQIIRLIYYFVKYFV